MHRPVGVSVIIPTLRNDRWLKLAIDSLLGNQGVNFEIIVVFDGTPIKNLPKWAEDERIHIIQKPVRQGQPDSSFLLGLMLMICPVLADCQIKSSTYKHVEMSLL